MDKKFLNKVVDMILRETRIGVTHLKKGKKGIQYPFTSFFLPCIPFFIPHSLFPFFTKHCKDIYGLNEQEIEYVWDRYRDIIKNKIENE
jgi:hypothetical protein